MKIKPINIKFSDLYILHIFNGTENLREFITKTANKQEFKSSIKKSFEILFTLINNFPKKIQKHVTTLHQVCMNILKSTMTTADVKIKALEVLNLSFEKINTSLDNPAHYEQIYKDLRAGYSFKKSNSVQEKILETLGTFSKEFQHNFRDQDSLRNLFITQLETQMHKKETSFPVVAGCLKGLKKFCESYPFDINVPEEYVIVQKLFQNIQWLSTPNSKIKVVNRAALDFLSTNIHLFSRLVIVEYIEWHKTLLSWLDMGPEEQKVGAFTLGAFYQGLATYIESDSSNAEYTSATLVSFPMRYCYQY